MEENLFPVFLVVLYILKEKVTEQIKFGVMFANTNWNSLASPSVIYNNHWNVTLHALPETLSTAKHFTKLS
jgi:hypothetical protein